LRPGQTPGSSENSCVAHGRACPPKLAARAKEGTSEEGNTQSNNYWSSTTYQNNPNNAWNVNFNADNVNNNNKSNNNYVRAVRGGL
jgi:hypothetical protein